MKLAHWVKRPSLLWLSAMEIRAVRDKIIGLYLEPGGYIEHRGIRIYGGAIPCFERTINAIVDSSGNSESCLQQAFFKYTKDKPPKWDFRWTKEGTENWSKIKTVPFDCSFTYWAASVVKEFHKEFPFKPTDNFIGYVEAIDPREE